jgi:very-short-patch-repair endonuclease
MPRPLPAELEVSRDIGGKPQTRPTDGEIAALARRQHGVFSRTQLVALGLGEDAIDARLGNGRLRRLHRGVYTTGHGHLPNEGWWLAAVMTVGEDAVLSHRSAAQLWGVARLSGGGFGWGRGGLSPIDVLAPNSTRSPAAIRRRFCRLEPDEKATRRGIPVTTLARTLFDLAAEMSPDPFEATLRQAEYLHRFRLEELERLMALHPGRRGARTIKACLRRLGYAPTGRSRSKLEDRFATVLAGADLPRAELNVLLDIDGDVVEADCLWRKQRVIVELDGRDAHETRAAFESDRERDRRLQAAGWRVIRVTWRQLDDPAAVLADLCRLLGQAKLSLPVS